jgi:dCTP deaminase
MILTGKEIKDQVSNNCIHIKPFLQENVNPNSYNYRLDNNLFEIISCPLDAKVPSQLQSINFDESGYVLNPNKIYLANTYEEIGSDYFVTSLIGRSSLGRLGLFLQITADLGNIGAKHKWTLEIKCVQPVRIYPKMVIGQVSFWQPNGERAQMYQGKYDKYSSAHSSELHQEFL